MTFTILTLFPEMVESVLNTSMLKRAADAGVVQFVVKNLRTWGEGAHQSVDDSPYGGGAGMLLRVDVVDRALAELTRITNYELRIMNSRPKVILLTPQGQTFTQETAESFAKDGRDLILIAGHYEGFDERIRSLVDIELSVGDFVVTGGELPALLVVDAVTRLLPGSLGSDDSAKEESFSLKLNSQLSTLNSRLLEYPHYTRPERYQPTSRPSEELTVPDVLTSGNHGQIAEWRKTQSIERTRRNRPDLLG